MPGSLEKPELHVEGDDDLHTIVHLLRRHGVDMSEGKRPVTIAKPEGGAVPLLDRMVDAARAASSRPVGFVLDIDVAIGDRWRSVRDRLRDVDVSLPDDCPQDGFMGQLKGYPFPMGVWLMPDCTREGGRLEHLLETLIPEGDRLWPHATKSTAEAKSIGASFSDVDEIKAEIHCWLAWQKDPGLPFGTAIKATFFDHKSAAALVFLRWIYRLFRIPELAGV